MDWNSSILWGIISIIASVFWGYFFYKLSTKKREITCNFDTTCIIHKEANQINSLNINYNSLKIQELNSSNIIIKNTGNTDINIEDVASKSPLKFTTDGIFILDEEINNELHQKYGDNKFKLYFETEKSGTCSTIIIDFDSILKKQSIIFSIKHTSDIHIEGRIKDGDIIETKNSAHNSGNNIKPKNIVLSCITISVIISIASYLFGVVSYQKRTEDIIQNLQNQIYTMQNDLTTSNDSIRYYYESTLKYLELLEKLKELNPSSTEIE